MKKNLDSRREGGYVLVLTLIMLVVGMIVVTPLLAFMGTGLTAGQVYERRVSELYAADAGVEDALQKIHSGTLTEPSWPLEVNQKVVQIEVDEQDSVAFIAQLLGLDEQNWVHSEWTVIGKVVEPGVIEISVAWGGSGNMKLLDVGIWVDAVCDYTEDQEIPEGDLRLLGKSPYVPDVTQESFGGGTAFIWSWTNDNAFQFKSDTPTQTITFHLTPELSPDKTIGFTVAGRNNVGLTVDEDFSAYTIIATATSDDDGTQTRVIARLTGCSAAGWKVHAWNIAPNDTG